MQPRESLSISRSADQAEKLVLKWFWLLEKCFNQTLIHKILFIQSENLADGNHGKPDTTEVTFRMDVLRHGERFECNSCHYKGDTMEGQNQ